MKAKLKSLIETKFPQLVARYRGKKFERLRTQLRPYKSEWGFTINGDMSYAMGFGRADTNRIQSGEAQAILKQLEGAELFIDIGANIGVLSMLASQNGCPQVIAVEPAKHNCQFLLENIESNNFQNITVFPMAMSAGSGVATIQGEGEMASLTENWNGVSATVSSRVPTIGFDDLFLAQIQQKRTLVKIDAEGHELEVMKGAIHSISQDDPPIWIIEHPIETDTECSPSKDPLIKLFLENGYRCRSLEAPEVKISARDENTASSYDSILNLLFWK
ncbi:MAG: FkbM family methyltransferase [Opitutales bacterium]|nr:FkbM family methyltransferase [Opitutales bacterium]